MNMAFLSSALLILATAMSAMAADPTPTPANPWGPSIAIELLNEARASCESAGVTKNHIANAITGAPDANKVRAFNSCIKGLSENGYVCTGYKKAQDSYAAFQKTCRESGSQNVLKCMETAAACAAQNEGEEGDLESVNTYLKKIGHREVTSIEELDKMCVKFSRKDYDTKKSDIGKELREAQKDLQTVQKERAKAAQDYQSDKRRLVERQSRVQEQMSKLIDSNQKEAQDRAQQMSKDLIDSEKEQAAVRVQNIQAQGQIAKVQGQRAQALAQLTDSIISANCTEQMQLLLKKWALEGPRSLNSSAALFQSNSEKKRRIQDQYRACIDTATAARKATRKQYSAEVEALKNQIKSNDQQAARIAEQNGQLGTNYQAFLARQKMSETEAYNRSLAELQAIQNESTEMDKVRNDRTNEANTDIKDATDRINALTVSMSKMGAEPRGDKRPNDAIPHMDDFMTQLSLLEGEPRCASLASELKTISSNDVREAYAKMYGGNAATATPTGGSPATPVRATPGSK